MKPQILITFPCSGIAEYGRFIHDDFLKKTLLQETQDSAEFVERAAPIIRQHVLGAIPYAGHGGSHAFMARLRRQGYDDETLSRALATAWLQWDDHFALPKQTLMTRLDKPVVRIGLAAFGALLLVLAAVLFLRQTQPEIAATLLAFEPLLAGAGVLTGFAIHAVLGRVFALLRGRTKPPITRTAD